MTGPQPGSEISARCLRRHRRALGIAGGLAVAIAGLDLARPWPLLLVVDNAIGRQPLDQPWATVLAPFASPFGLALVAGPALFSSGVASAIVSYLSSYLSGVIAEQIAGDLRAILHPRLVSQASGLHVQRRPADLAARATDDVNRIRTALLVVLTNLLPQTLTLVGTAAVLVAIDPALVPASLLVVSPLAVAFADARSKMRAAQLERLERQVDLAARVTEAIRNARLVQALAREHHIERAVRRRSDEVARSGQVVADLTARQQATAAILVAASATLVLWIGAGAVMSGAMTVGLLVVVLCYTIGVYLAARSLAWSSSVLGDGLASWKRVAEIMSTGEPADQQAPVLASPRDGIVLRGVSFAYVPGRPVLRGLDLRIPAAGSLAVVGPAGAGKSTLLGLLLRLYEPDEGSIEIDGVDLGSFDPRSVRERLAFVPQKPMLFEGSLIENMALGRAGASLAEVIEAARLARVDDFAQSLPDGYHAQIGEDGAILSVGQQWRVGLARALVRHAPVLLLDDPSLGVDLEGEPDLVAAVRRAPGVRMVVMVTRNQTVAALADRIVMLREGRISETTPPAPPALAAPGPAPSQQT
jgi:ABC-type multidrug transport system fused ATPase/permease subunit